MFVKSLNCKNDLGIFHIIFLSLFFSCSSYSYAQKLQNPNKVEQVTVVLKDGAKIFSTDEAFNNQISSNTVILKNAEILQQNSNSTTVLQATSKEKVIKKDPKKGLEAAVEKKQKEEVKKVEKEINQHEERKKTFNSNNYKGFPTSERIIASSHINQDYVAPSYSDSFSKMYAVENIYIAFVALDFLHSQKITHYNSKSLDFCFSDVFCVRPPPLSI